MNERTNGSYVQYGCGYSAPAGWDNFDASPTLRFERVPFVGRLYSRNGSRFPENVRYGDIVRGLPIGPGSCAGIYCSHVLEHLARDEVDQALENTHRYLSSGGTFRLVVPDLRQLAGDYMSNHSQDAACQFMESASLGKAHRPRGIAGLLRDWLGNSAHLWMWDEHSMATRLRRHGFTAIRRCRYGDATDSKFSEVEDESRFDGALAMECRKS